MLSLFRSCITYRVHGAAHPRSIKARALAVRMARLALAEQRVMSQAPAPIQSPEPVSGRAFVTAGRKTPGRRFSDGAKSQLVWGDKSDLPVMNWRDGRVYVAGDDTGYETLADALQAWSGRAA